MDLEDFHGNSVPTQGFLSNYNNRAPEPFGMNYNSMNPYVQQNYSSFTTFQQPFNNEINHNSMFEFPQTTFGQQQNFSMMNNSNLPFGQSIFTNNTNNNNQNMFLGQVKTVKEDEHEEDDDFRPDEIVESESDDNEYEDVDDLEDDQGNFSLQS